MRPALQISGEKSRKMQSTFYLSFSGTSAGYVSWLDDVDGSYFIRCLCKALREQHMKSELHAIALKVNNMVAMMTGDEGELNRFISFFFFFFCKFITNYHNYPR